MGGAEPSRHGAFVPMNASIPPPSRLFPSLAAERDPLPGIAARLAGIGLLVVLVSAGAMIL